MHQSIPAHISVRAEAFSIQKTLQNQDLRERIRVRDIGWRLRLAILLGAKLFCAIPKAASA